MYLRAWTLLASFASGAFLASAGCEFIASADRNLIPPEDAGSEAGEGTGGTGAQNGSTTGTNTGSASGGGGGEGACAASGDCPGEDTPCAKRTCTSGQCGVEYEPGGTPLPDEDQIPSDCKMLVCDGSGAALTQPDAADLPLDVGQCTYTVCNGDQPGVENEIEGTFCARGGGNVCDGDGNCVECTPLAGGCPFGDVCVNETCVPPMCMDLAKNGDETDVDCGGTVCLPCADGLDCEMGSDCESGVCTAMTCAAPTCSDMVENGNETDVDCGGGTCPDCVDDGDCMVDGDCVSNICDAGKCGLNGCTLATAVDITATPTVTFGGAAGDNYVPKCFVVSAGTMVTFEGEFSLHPLVGGKVVAGIELPAGASSPFFPTTSSGVSKTFTLAAGRYGFFCDNHGQDGMRGAAFVVP